MHITADKLPRLRGAMQSNAWFAKCDEGMQHALISLAAVRCLKHGEILCRKDQISYGLYCVISGRIRIEYPGKRRPVLLVDYMPYEWIGELPIIDDMADGVIATAFGETSVAQIERSVVLDWLKENPVYWRDFARLMACRFRYGSLMLLHTMSLPLEERIVQRLYLISTGYGMRTVPTSKIQCSQDELANMVGASRPSVTTALKKLATKGLLDLRYGEIRLLKLLDKAD